MKELILIDVFSYSCMNCLRSLEHIKKLDKQYSKHGLRTVIVHPPEWEFEKNKNNLEDAMKRHNIFFPVLIDKDKKMIKKFGINFWPAQLLIKNNKAVYKHVGEGSYFLLENKIRNLLGVNPKRIFNKNYVISKYPTIYAGKRKKGIIKKTSGRKKFGEIYIKGKWLHKMEYLGSLENNCSLAILAKGRIVNLVAESFNRNSSKAKISLNGRFIKTLPIDGPRLYKILKRRVPMKNETLTLEFGKKTAVYSFSFE